MSIFRRRDLWAGLAGRLTGLGGDLRDQLVLDVAVDEGRTEVEALDAAIRETVRTERGLPPQRP